MTKIIIVFAAAPFVTWGFLRTFWAITGATWNADAGAGIAMFIGLFCAAIYLVIEGDT